MKGEEGEGNCADLVFAVVVAEDWEPPGVTEDSHLLESLIGDCTGNHHFCRVRVTYLQ